MAEWAAVVATSPGERPYAARVAGLGLGLQLAAVAPVALLAWALGRRRQPELMARCCGALAPGLAVTLGLLFILPNGLPRLVPPGSLGAATVASVALAVGAGAGLLRWRFIGHAGRPAPVLETLLVAMGLVLPYVGLRLARIPTMSPRGLALWGAALSLALLVGLAAAWRRRAGPGGWWLAVPPLAAAALIAASVAWGRAPYPPLPPRAAGAPDVILVVLDTVRADFAPADATSPRPTPALRRLAAEGTRFTHAFSTTCWTVPAHASLFTGLIPSEHGATWASPSLPDTTVTLAERFSARGWRTGAFSANPWITPEFGFHQGFERFATGRSDRRPLTPWLPALFSILTRREDGFLMFEDKAGLTLVSEALRWLAADDPRPAFLFVNLMEAHLPYLPPRRFLGDPWREGWSQAELRAVNQHRLEDLLPGARRTPREMEGLRLLYEAEVSFADHLVGHLALELERSGRLQNTILLVTSDHGENLGDHPPLDHQLGLYDTLVRVPLIIHGPGRVPAGVEDDRLISLTDVPDLLLPLAGIGAREANGLPDGARREAVFLEYDRPLPILEQIRDQLGLDPTPWDRSLAGVRTRQAKWIEASDGRHQAFDLEADPGERTNLALDDPAERFASLRARLEEGLLQRRRAHPSQRTTPLSPEAEERLRSLGYVK